MRAVLLISVGILIAASGRAHAYLGGPEPYKLSKLIRLLKVRDFQSPDWVPTVIGQRGHAAREARPALLAALNEEGRDIYFRGACVRALALTGPPEQFVLEALRKLCRDDQEFSVRAYAAAALVRLDPAVGQEYLQILADGLAKQDIESRLTAVESLALLGSPSNAAAKTLFPLLVNQVQDADMHIRANAATALVKVSPAAPETITAIVKALQDQDEFVRYRAARDCRELGAAAAVSVTQLRNLLRDRFDHARLAAAEALGAIGPDAQAAVPELIVVLADPRVRETANEALAKIGAAAIPSLIVKLHSERPEDRWQACRALTVMGPTAAHAFPEVLPLLHDEDASVRCVAALALGSLHGDDEMGTRAALSNALSDADANVRVAAASSFTKLGRIPAEAIRVLLTIKNGAPGNWFEAGLVLQSVEPEELPGALKLLQDDDVKVRQAAFLLVGRLGQSDPAVAGAAILQAMTDDAGKVPWPAVESLQSLVSKHSGLLEQILARQHDENPEVRCAVAHILGAVDNADGKAAAEALVALLADPLTRRESRRALVELGSRSDAALEVLLTAICDADEPSRWEIVWTLGQINATPNQEYWTVDFCVDPTKASDRIGKTAEKIAPTLCRALEDSAPGVREAAGHMLVAIRPTKEIGTLVEALRSPRATPREAAAKVLGELGLDARAAIPALVTALADKDSSVQRAAAGALVHVGVGSKVAAGALAKAIDRETDDVDPFNSNAACILHYLSFNSKPEGVAIDDTLTAHLLPVLLRKLQSQHADTACDARRALIDLGGERPQVIILLEDIAKMPRDETRAQANEAIVAIERERASRRTSITEALASFAQ